MDYHYGALISYKLAVRCEVGLAAKSACGQGHLEEAVKRGLCAMSLPKDKFSGGAGSGSLGEAQGSCEVI